MTTASTAVSTWTIDGAHSIAEFAVKHMMVATVKGRFRTLSGRLTVDEANPAASFVNATIDVASIDTGEAQRDGHLRSDDFFNAEAYPEITFRSTRVERVDDSNYKVTGDLTIRDVTKQVVLEVEYDGRITDAYGKQRAAFSAETAVNRKEFGLNWNGVIETGGVIVGDRVRITLHISAVRDE